jgi:hypothetical protein
VSPEGYVWDATAEIIFINLRGLGEAHDFSETEDTFVIHWHDTEQGLLRENCSYFNATLDHRARTTISQRIGLQPEVIVFDSQTSSYLMPYEEGVGNVILFEVIAEDFDRTFLTESPEVGTVRWS